MAIGGWILGPGMPCGCHIWYSILIGSRGRIPKQTPFSLSTKMIFKFIIFCYWYLWTIIPFFRCFIDFLFTLIFACVSMLIFFCWKEGFSRPKSLFSRSDLPEMRTYWRGRPQQCIKSTPWHIGWPKSKSIDQTQQHKQLYSFIWFIFFVITIIYFFP